MNKQQLYSILDAITDGVIIIRHDHSIEFMNQAMIDIFGPANNQKCYQVIYTGWLSGTYL